MAVPVSSTPSFATASSAVSSGTSPGASYGASIDVVERLIAERRAELERLRGRVRAIARTTDWQTPSARGYHDRAERLDGELRVLLDRLDEALEGLHALRRHLAEAEWRGALS